VLFTASLHAQTTTNRWTGSTGDWTNTANWSAAVAPSATDVLFITNDATSYVVTIDSATPSSQLTNFSLTVGFPNSSALTTQRVDVLSAPDVWRLNDTLTISRPRGRVFIADSSVSVGTNVRVAGTLTLTNSNLIVTSPTSSTGVQIGGQNAVLYLTGGSVTVTNSGNNAVFTVGNSSLGGGALLASNTLLRVNSFSVGAGGSLIDNTGLASTNLLRNVTVSVSGTAAANLTLVGGIYDGTVQRVALGAGVAGSGAIATITNRGAVWNMSNGDLSIGNTAGMHGFFVQDGGTSRTVRVGSDTGEFRIGGVNNATGTLTVINGFLSADGDAGVSGAGALAVGALNGSVGTFNQYGGRVVVTNSAALGNNATVRMGVRGQGFFNMTNGTMLADRFVLGTNAQSFVVGKDALIEIKQAVAFSNVAPLSLTNNFAFDGTLKFSPATATMTQQFQLAGLDLGASFNGYSNNFAIGTLDLSSFGAGNRLRVVSPFNLPSTGLYVHAISAIATNQLISSFNIYYEDVLNPALNSETYALTGGGSLIPIITIPEPSALLFACAGLWALFLRRRSR
jgi:hypothetical protein